MTSIVQAMTRKKDGERETVKTRLCWLGARRWPLSTSADNTLLDLHISSDITKAESNNC